MARKRKRNLKWGQTPWDKLSREELLREVQRAFAATEASRGVLLQTMRVNPASPFWGPEGIGGRALEMVEQVVGSVYSKFDAESVYRSFFRYADDLLFNQRRVCIGSGWAVCPNCGAMVGALPDGRGPQIGAPCPHGARVCTGILRELRWSDLDPKEGA